MNFNQIKFGKPVTYLDGVVNYLKGAMIWGFRSKYKWSQTTPDIWGFANPNDIDPESQVVYDRIIADGGVSNLTRLNYFVVGLKTIYGSLTNVPVCYDAHWIGYKLGSGTGATAGQAAAKLYSLTVAGDAVQATAASQPLLLAHNGASSDNYYQSIVGGGYCQTLTNLSPQINTDFTFEFNFKNLTEVGILGGCPASSANGWSLQIQTGINALRFYGRNSTANVVSLISTAGITIVGNRWVKVIRSGNDYSFWEKADGGNYSQVGSTITNTTVLNSYTLPIQVCNGFTPNFVGISCAMLKANFYQDATSTTLVSTFNPTQYNASTSQTQWTSSTGEIWTISTGTATSGYKGTIVDRVIVQSDGVDDYLDNATFVRNNTMTQYLAFSSQAGSVSGVPQIIDSSSTNYTNSIFQNVSLLMSSWMNGASTMGSAPNLLNRRYILSANYNAGISNNLNLNNIAGSVSTYSPTPSATGIRLFSKGGAVSSHNATITTYVYCVNNDTANNTAMFNFLKTLNNL